MKRVTQDTMREIVFFMGISSISCLKLMKDLKVFPSDAKRFSFTFFYVQMGTFFSMFKWIHSNLKFTVIANLYCLNSQWLQQNVTEIVSSTVYLCRKFNVDLDRPDALTFETSRRNIINRATVVRTVTYASKVEKEKLYHSMHSLTHTSSVSIYIYLIAAYC